jgi:hypothetical protein
MASKPLTVVVVGDAKKFKKTMQDAVKDTSGFGRALSGLKHIAEIGFGGVAAAAGIGIAVIKSSVNAMT